MSLEGAVVLERAVRLGAERWLHVVALQRPRGRLVVLLRDIPTALPQVEPVAMPARLELELPPHATLELARALAAIGHGIGVRT